MSKWPTTSTKGWSHIIRSSTVMKVGGLEGYPCNILAQRWDGFYKVKVQGVIDPIWLHRTVLRKIKGR